MNQILFIIAYFSNILGSPRQVLISHSEPSIINEKCDNFVEFVIKIYQMEFDQYFGDDKTFVRGILSCIYKTLGEKNKKRLMLFVATSLHHTTFYTIFECHESGNHYKPRGLIGLTGRVNYMNLKSISAYKYDYLKNPDLLSATDDVLVFKDTIKLWINFYYNDIFTFSNTLKCFEIGIDIPSNIIPFSMIYIRLLEAGYN